MKRIVGYVGMLGSMAMLLSACGPLPDEITDCDTSTTPITCRRDERFPIAGTTLVVNELENITDSDDHARVEADITLEGDPATDLQAQLRIVNPITEKEVTVDPESPLSAAGDRKLSWDFSGQGWGPRIQNNYSPPTIFIIFDDGETTVRVNVMSVEYY